jgi:putative ubiquitin-RnfH superfamily antitoxin RatB of RatAB toxin-antitoxin module
VKDAGETIQVEVVFGLAKRQTLRSVEVDSRASCSDAISASGILSDYPEIDLAELPIAIWGKLAQRHDPLRNGDRIELLRPLEIDPRDARRRLASEGQFMGGSPVQDPDRT